MKDSFEEFKEQMDNKDKHHNDDQQPSPPLEPMIEPYYFTPSTKKFAVMSILTFGLYNLYWFYKNFSLIKRRRNDSTMPLLRTIFSFFFCFALFRDISQLAEKSNLKNVDNYWVQTIMFVLLSIIGANLEPLLIFSHLNLIPLLIANLLARRVNEANIENYEADDNFTGGNIALMVLGAIFTYFAFLNYQDMLKQKNQQYENIETIPNFDREGELYITNEEETRKL